jgi:hypothetical protein
MEEEFEAPWWHAPLRGIAIFLGLLVLSGLLMGLIIGVARFLDSKERSGVNYSPPVFISSDAPQEKNARTHVASPYDPVPWPNRPDRAAGVGDKISRITSGGRSGTGSSGGASGDTAATERSYSGPVGVSVEEYQAAAASGKKMFIPDPKGECDLGGKTGGRALESCFAERVAR